MKTVWNNFQGKDDSKIKLKHTLLPENFCSTDVVKKKHTTPIKCNV